MSYLLSFILSFVLAISLTPLVKTLAILYGKMALPTKDRWHQKPTALLGGVAIFISFWVSTWLLNPHQKLLVAIFPASSVLFCVGILDDFVPIKPASKLIGQILAACFMIFSGLFFHLNPLISVPVSVLWYVGLMNAFNLLDNMDGLAAGIACIASLTLGFYLMSSGQTEIVLAAMALAGAAMGFLLYNTHPARIFMGDCGSMFLGHLLGALALLGADRNPSGLVMTLLIPVLLLSVPIFDTIFVTLTRFFHARPISQGGNDHTSHRLVAFGVSQKRAVWILYGISLISGSVILLSTALRGSTVLVLAILLTILLTLFGMFLGEIKIYSKSSSSAAKEFPNSKKGFVLDVLFQHRRRFAEVLMDLTLICLAYYSAFYLKFDAVIPHQMQRAIVEFLPVAIACHLANFFLFGLYRGVWKYAGLTDVLAIMKAVTAGTFVIGVLIESVFQFEGYSRPILAIFWLLLVVLVSGSRIATRLFFEFLSSSITRQKRAAIMGAGDAGELLLRILQSSTQREYEPVAFVDDDPKKIGKMIHGVPVLGNRRLLAQVVEREKIETVFVAIPSATPEQIREIEEECRLHNIPYRLVGTLFKSAQT